MHSEIAIWVHTPRDWSTNCADDKTIFETLISLAQVSYTLQHTVHPYNKCIYLHFVELLTQHETEMRARNQGGKILLQPLH